MIETPRLLLRPHSLDDFEATYAMSSDPVVARFLGGHQVSREDVWNKLLRNVGHWSLLGFGLLTITEKETGAFVGHTGLADFHRGLGESFDPFPEAAWVLTRDAHGKGFASEATAAVHRWFDALARDRRTVCIINPANTASIGVAAKLGYRPFGQGEYRGGTVTMFERLRPG